MTIAKKTARSQCLSRLRAWAKERPEEVEKASQILCNKLYTYLHTQSLAPMHTRAPPSSSTRVPASSRTLYLCTYLPLYYEVNLLPFMHRVWADRLLPHHSRETVLMVPVVVEPPKPKLKPSPGTTSASVASSPTLDTECPPGWKEWHRPYADAAQRLQSAMVFAEVRDAQDVQLALEEKGVYHIRELRDEVFLEFFGSAAKKSETGAAVTSTTPVETRAGVTASSPRRILCCAEWERLFPEHAPPPGLVRISHTGSDTSVRSDVVVLAPGVLFSRTDGSRLGKGGGFYDRFLQYLGRGSEAVCQEDAGSSSSANDSTGTECSGRHRVAVEIIGIGFDEQMLAHSVPHNAATDVSVDAVASPTDGVYRIVRSQPLREEQKLYVETRVVA